jgi:hypothetical protein
MSYLWEKSSNDLILVLFMVDHRQTPAKPLLAQLAANGCDCACEAHRRIAAV